MHNLKIYNEVDLMAIESFSEKSREIIVAYIREHTVILSREEDGKVLEAQVFGDRCLKVMRDWLLNPMPEWEKAKKLELYREIRE
jgi:hypothetical protein